MKELDKQNINIAVD